MNRSAIVIAAPLLALIVAIAIRQTLRARRSGLPSNAAKPKAEAPQAAVGTRGASAQNAAPKPPAADAAPPQAPPPAISQGAITTAGIRPQLRPIAEAIENSYASTIAAFALRGEEAEYETHDAQAQRDADRLREVFSSMRADLSPELASVREGSIDRISSAQLQ